MKIRFIRDTDLIDGNFDEVFYAKYEELEVKDINEDGMFGDQVTAIRVCDGVELILPKENFELIGE